MAMKLIAERTRAEKDLQEAKSAALWKRWDADEKLLVKKIDEVGGSYFGLTTAVTAS